MSMCTRYSHFVYEFRNIMLPVVIRLEDTLLEGSYEISRYTASAIILQESTQGFKLSWLLENRFRHKVVENQLRSEKKSRDLRRKMSRRSDHSPVNVGSLSRRIPPLPPQQIKFSESQDAPKSFVRQHLAINHNQSHFYRSRF